VHDELRRQGCDQAQGFLYGRPMSAEMATELLVGGDLKAA
jgi:EAL domain-containing protein (putative c-di-GMP-specific phosphodiesterase class I)